MHFENIPDGSMLSILALLDFKSILRMKAVSKTWCKVVSPNQPFWRGKFEADFWVWEGGEVDFEREYRIEYGWRKRKPRVVTLPGHVDKAEHVGVAGSVVVSCSSAANVKVWDLERMECVREIQEDECVCSVVLHNGKLLTGLKNGCIHVWSLKCHELFHKWQAHNNSVWDILTSNGRIVTWGWDQLVKVWETDTWQCVHSFQLEYLEGVYVHGDEIFCGCVNGFVHVYHQTNGFLYTIDAGGWVSTVCANSKYIFADCGGGRVRVWDSASKQCVKVLKHGERFINGMECDEKKLVSALLEGQLMVWDVATWRRRTLKLGMGGLRSMHWDREKVVVAFECGMIRVFDFVS